MRLKRLLLTALAVLLLTGLVSASALAAPAGNGSPYYITVNRQTNSVTVYGLDGDGYYTEPVRSMICSTGKPGEETPLGTYAMNDQKYTWCGMIDGSYAQYACAFYGNYMIHSVCYNERDRSTLMYNEYNDLGSSVSLGCVRLQTIDAKWIFDNCPVGTLVNIYESADPGPLGMPQKAVPLITEATANGWDPTDPDPDNPWLIIKPTGIEMSRALLALETGCAYTLTASVVPADAVHNPAVWSSSAPDVASVSDGRVTALSSGTAVITARCSGFTASCEVTVTGSPLPFTDVIAGRWYYPHIRKAVGLGIFTGESATRFAPEAEMTRAMLVQTLYNLAGKPSARGALPFEDVASGDWFADAVTWAYKRGVVTGVTDKSFAPDDIVTREQMAAMLYRYTVNVLRRPAAVTGSIDGFTDAGSVSPYALYSMRWAVARGVIEGDDSSRLHPRSGATRAEAAAMLVRFSGLL